MTIISIFTSRKLKPFKLYNCVRKIGRYLNDLTSMRNAVVLILSLWDVYSLQKVAYLNKYATKTYILLKDPLIRAYKYYKTLDSYIILS